MRPLIFLFLAFFMFCSFAYSADSPGIGTSELIPYLEHLSELGQYQIGLLSFIGGIVLAFVFIFGLHLR